MRSLQVLQDEYSSCTRCELSQTRNNVVFGYGNPSAQILVIGEGPGETEDHTGLPFVGPAGQWLDYFLASVSVHPEVMKLMKARTKRPDKYNAAAIREFLLQEYYFTNVVCCRPPGNRDPANAEIDACRERLVESITLVDPVLIITAGKIALEALLGRKVKSILAKRGELYEVRLPGKFVPVTYPVLSILHPSFLMRNASDDVGGYSAKTFNDVLKAAKIIDEYNNLHYGIPAPKDRPGYITIQEN